MDTTCKNVGNGYGVLSFVNKMRIVVIIVFGMITFFSTAGRAFEMIGPPESEYQYFDERCSIDLGVMHPFINTQIQVNKNNALPGTFFDFETDLGLAGDVVSLLGDVNYRIGKHAAFELTWLEIQRSSTKMVSKDIQFGDRTFSANATVNAFVNTQYYLLNYKYSFVRNTHTEFGGSFGLNFANVSAGMSLASAFNGPLLSTGASSSQGQEQSFLAPAPLLGIYFSSQFLPKTFFRNAIQYIDVSAGNYSFRSLNYMVGVDYLPWHNFGIGVGVYSNRLQIAQEATLNGKFIYNITGTFFYGRYFF